MNHDFDRKKVFLLISGLIVFFILIFGIEPDSSKLTNKYWYCWNNFSLRRILNGSDPHHYGHHVIGDHLCTFEELSKY